MRQYRKLIIFIAVVIVALSVFCAKVMKKGNPQTLIVTDKDGITYLAIYDQNSNLYAGITDGAGNLYAARMDENGEVVMDEAMYAVNNYSGTLPTNNTTAVAIQQTNPTDYDYVNVDVSKVEEQTDSTTDVQSPSEAPSGAKTHLADEYIKLFNSGTYYISFSTDDPDLPGNIQTAFKNGNIYMDTVIEDMACQVVYKKNENTGFIVIPDLRVYCILPDDIMAEMSDSNLSFNNDSGVVAVEEFSAVLGDRECKCEEYSYADGSKGTYYFYNNSLVRLDITESDGTTAVYNINSISSAVDDSLFERPKGLVRLNLSWLNMSLFG